uniref:Uncharacterized protein n=1 Tax=Nelumbo nucifera TaxID=4432 RepID=A0A822XNY0_NELNU|nr:TPA_asm: hypothetical protein HUJ06_022089 [Nelumbo nucifera]
MMKRARESVGEMQEIFEFQKGKRLRIEVEEENDGIEREVLKFFNCDLGQSPAKILQLRSPTSDQSCTNRYEHGSFITSSGALATLPRAKTEDDELWWGK